MKLHLEDVRVDQTVRYYRKGSVLAGTIKSGSLGVEARIDVVSNEPPEKIAELIRVAKESCFTHGALTQPVTVDTDVRLNGKPLT